MKIARRQLMTALPACAAVSALPSLAQARRVDPDQPRTLSYTPAAALSPEDRARHEKYMAMAIDMIQRKRGPFASVIVDRTTDQVVCKGLNENYKSPIFHGEIVAINACAALQRHRNWGDLTLYTTGESCPMCQSAIIWAGIGETVYGTSVATLRRLGANQFSFDTPTIAAAAPFYQGAIVGGVLAERTDPIYQAWAERRRQRRKSQEGG